MKKLLCSLMTAVLLCSPGWAANTATDLGSSIIRECGHVAEMYNIAIDTTGQDLTIATPASTNALCVVGAFGVETNAANVTFKSGTTTLVVPELAANQGMSQAVGNGVIFCTLVGQALKIQSSAAYSSLLLHVVETDHCDNGVRP